MTEQCCNNPHCPLVFNPKEEICKKCIHNIKITEKLEDDDIYNFLFGGKK